MLMRLLDNDEQASFVLSQKIINQIIINTFYLSQKVNKIEKNKIKKVNKWQMKKYFIMD